MNHWFGYVMVGMFCFSIVGVVQTSGQAASQEFYELRTYRIENADNQNAVSKYLERALVPALNRLGLDRIGVFTRMESDDADDFSITMLIPFPTTEAFTTLNDRLAADSEYQQASAEFFAIPKDDPAYTRVESKFMKAFAGMPVIEMPAQSAGKQPRMFELRTYESHNAEKARLKVDMFNSGEIQVMRDVKMAPVFYGETLIGPDVPNLTYMLSASDMEAHQEHWGGFRTNPDWNKMKGLAKYKNTVSKINKWYLVPTPYSQI